MTDGKKYRRKRGIGSPDLWALLDWLINDAVQRQGIHNVPDDVRALIEELPRAQDARENGQDRITGPNARR